MKKRLFGTRLPTEEPQVSRTLVYHDGMHLEDDFKPAQFRSTRQHRQNFERIQENTKVSDDLDGSTVSFERELKLYDLVRAMLREQLVSLGFSKGEAQTIVIQPKRKPKISLSYEDEEDEFIDTAKRVRLDLARGDAMQKKVLFTSRKMNTRQDSLGYIQRNFTRLQLEEEPSLVKTSRDIPQAPADYMPREIDDSSTENFTPKVVLPPSLSSRFVSASETLAEEDSGEILPHISLQSRKIEPFEVSPLILKRLGLT